MSPLPTWIRSRIQGVMNIVIVGRGGGRERERVWHSLKILKYLILLSCLGQHTHALVKHLDLDGICAAVQQMNLQKYTIMIMQAMTGIAP